MKTFVTVFKLKQKFLHFYVFITGNYQKGGFKVINSRDEPSFNVYICCMKNFQGLVCKLSLLHFFMLTVLQLQEIDAI
jgi:hypothetical protein